MSTRVIAALATPLLIAGGLIWLFAKHHAVSQPTAGPTSPSASSAAPTSTAPSDTQIYRNEANGLTLNYPRDVKIEARSSTDPQYEADFLFKTGSSTVPITLQITDLDKYLPLTGTPTIREYLQSLSGLEKFKKATVDDKDAYEYLVCGRAACSQEVIFIHNGKQYQFSIKYAAYFTNEQINGSMKPKSISFETAPSYIRQIIESVQFLPAK